jgi:probable HAF family extracellular repeat protein
MNDHGEIVGYVRGSTGDWPRPFMWDSGTLIDLNSGEVIPPVFADQP